MTIRRPFILLFIFFVTIGVYYPTLFAPFNSTDDVKLINWLLNIEDINLYNLFFPGGSGYYYRPLLILTFLLDLKLWGLQESFMHLGNILLHAFNTLLVYAIATRISSPAPNARIVGVVASLFFALHPLNTEAVNWISGRTDLLSGLFILTATLLLLIALDNRSISAMLAASISLVIATLAKETAIFFLPGALFMIYCRVRSKDGSEGKLFTGWNLFGYLAITAAGVSYFAFRSIAFSKGDVGVKYAATQMAESSVDYLSLIRVAVKLGGFYLKKIVIPWPLNFGIIKVPDYYLFPGAILLIIIAYLLYRRDLVASLFFAGICIGSSALIVALGRMAWTPVAERYMYIPSAFMVIGATVLISSKFVEMRHGERFCSYAAIIVLSVFAISSTMRNITWQDNLTLFTDTVQKSPDFLPARNDKALALINRGKVEDGFKIIKGIDAPESSKNWEQTATNKAAVMVSEGKIDEARKILKPMAVRSWRNQINSIEMLLRIDEKLLVDSKRGDSSEIGAEVVELLEMLQKLTGSPFYYYRIGQTHLALKNRKEAGKYFALAYEKSSPGEYYREPAGKLAKSLRAGSATK
jgi:hypothetical protein